MVPGGSPARPFAAQTLTRSLDEVTAAKEAQTKELSAALVFLKEKKDASEARLTGQLQHAEVKRKAETSALKDRVAHLRELQQQALDHVLKGGKARQAAFMESLKTPGKKDSPCAYAVTPALAFLDSSRLFRPLVSRHVASRLVLRLSRRYAAAGLRR